MLFWGVLFQMYNFFFYIYKFSFQGLNTIVSKCLKDVKQFTYVNCIGPKWAFSPNSFILKKAIHRRFKLSCYAHYTCTVFVQFVYFLRSEVFFV